MLPSCLVREAVGDGVEADVNEDAEEDGGNNDLTDQLGFDRMAVMSAPSCDGADELLLLLELLEGRAPSMARISLLGNCEVFTWRRGVQRRARRQW